MCFNIFNFYYCTNDIYAGLIAYLKDKYVDSLLYVKAEGILNTFSCQCTKEMYNVVGIKVVKGN